MTRAARYPGAFNNRLAPFEVGDVLELQVPVKGRLKLTVRSGVDVLNDAIKWQKETDPATLEVSLRDEDLVLVTVNVGEVFRQYPVARS